MVRSKLPILMAEKRINITRLSEETGINRSTIRALYHETGQGIRFDTIGKLCNYFDCDVGDLLKYENCE